MKHRIIHLSCIAALALIAASIYHGKSSTAIAGHTEPGQIWMLDFLTPCWDSPNPPCLKLFPFSVISGGVGSMDGLDQWASRKIIPPSPIAGSQRRMDLATKRWVTPWPCRVLRGLANEYARR